MEEKNEELEEEEAETEEDEVEKRSKRNILMLYITCFILLF